MNDEDMIKKLKILFRMYIINPNQNLSNEICEILKIMIKEKKIKNDEKLHLEFFTSLLPIYSINKKNYTKLFFENIVINTMATKIFK